MSRVTEQAHRPAPGPDTLFFAIGNCGRRDDGLGWAFVDRIQQEGQFDSPVEYRYQLQVEDAALASRMASVVFVDSYKGELEGGFQWQSCEPSENFEFTTHVLPPRAVMHYCRDLFGKNPRAYLLQIQGTHWDLQEGLSAQASRHLERALEDFRARLQAHPTA